MSIVVTGYASLDYTMRLASPPQPDRTTTILSRAPQWPRLGGSPAYVAAALVSAGQRDAAPVSWIGDDAEGVAYRNGLEALRVRTDGLAVSPGRTPICVLAYQPDGRCHCLYDPGLTVSAELNERQRMLVEGAEAICVTVGPTRATWETLRLASASVALAWAVKADRRAVPPDLAQALAARANVVVFSRGEAGFAAEAFAAADASARIPLRVETRGREGVAYTQNGVTRIVPSDPIDADDSTGAGDTFVGGFLAAWMRTGDAETAIEAGVGAARALLLGRPGAVTRG